MRRWIVLLFAVGLLAACGGGGSKTAASSSSTSSSSSSLPSGGVVGATAADCEEASRALDSAGSSGSGLARDDAFAARDAMLALKKVVDTDDMKDALQTMADAYDAYGNAVGDFDPSGNDVPPQAVISALQEFATQDFIDATQKFTTFLTTGCNG